MAGKLVGRLFVLGRADHNNRQGSALWRCVCSCGNRKIVCGGDLRSRHVLSCGCLRRETSAAYARLMNEYNNRRMPQRHVGEQLVL